MPPDRSGSIGFFSISGGWSMARSRTPAPLKAVWTLNQGKAVPLPARLGRLYGRFRLPEATSRPHIFSNFVTTLDGVVSLHVRGHATGQDISGCNEQDRLVMGLLRAVADVVVVGAGTLAADRQHVWTPEMICPALASDFAQLRKELGKSGAPLNVVVSGSGSLDLRLPVFSSGAVQVMIVTSDAGAKRLAKQRVPQGVDIRTVRTRGSLIAPGTIINEIRRDRRVKQILLESGPRLSADFYQQRLVSEQFLTLAPQIAGRKDGDGRLGMAMGQQFAPRNPLWGQLVDVRQAGSHLFLRYSFA
jgi:riboflavin biosynthesis pyrimidine reductase